MTDPTSVETKDGHFLVFAPASRIEVDPSDPRSKVEQVRAQLKAHRDTSQKETLEILRAQRVEHHSFWITSMILVPGEIADDLSTLRFEGDRNRQPFRVMRNERTLLEEPDQPVPMSLLDDYTNRPWNLEYLNSSGMAHGTRGLTGKGVLVAIIDSGINWKHPAIQENYNGWSGSPESTVHEGNWHDATERACGEPCFEPEDDHGTKTTSIAVGGECRASRSRESFQIGVGPGASWVACKAFEGRYGTISALAECLEWVLERDVTPDIVNLSAGFDPEEGAKAILPPMFEALDASGVILVTSTGNPKSGTEPSSIVKLPAVLPQAITVGGLYMKPDRSIALNPHSGRGPSGETIKPDLVAPGSNVRAASTRAGACSSMYGTSASAPQVTGVLALLIERCPRLRGRPDLVRELLQFAVDPRLLESCERPEGAPNNDIGFGLPRPSCLVAGLVDSDFQCGLDE